MTSTQETGTKSKHGKRCEGALNEQKKKKKADYQGGQNGPVADDDLVAVRVAADVVN
jgi:hypothetical protein